MRRHLWVVAISVFLVGWGTNVSTPFLVLYRDRLGLGEAATVGIFTVYVIGIVATLPLAGPASDRFGRKAIVIPFVVVSGAASLVLVAGRDSFALLLAGRLLLGVVSGAVLGVSAAWIQELLGRNQPHRAALISTVVTYGGFGIGPLVSAAFAAWGDRPLVDPFVLHAALSFLVVPLLTRVPETMQPADRPDRIVVQLGVPSGTRYLFRRLIVPAAIWVFAFPATSFALFPVILQEAVGGSIVTVAAIAGVFTAWSALLAGPIARRIGARRCLAAGMAIGAAGFVLGTLSFVTDLWPLVFIASAAFGCASGTLTAGALGVLAEIAEPGTRGSINSTFYLLAYPSMGTPIVLSLVGSAIGLTGALILVTVMSAGVAAMLAARVRHDGQALAAR